MARNVSSHHLAPKVSIITVALNAGDHIEETILSILNQTYKNIELIIIDGGSTDDTVAIIKKYAHSLAYWVSESDSGIYDAMNKGIRASTGEWILFLGSDDKLVDHGTIAHVADSLRDDLSVLFGNIIYDDGKIIRSRLSLLTLLHNTVHHQSAFYRKTLFAAWKYDSTFKLIGDYELNLIIYLQKMKHRYINTTVALCDQYGQSRRDYSLAYKETNAVRSKHISGIYGRFLALLYTMKFLFNKG